MGKLISSLIVTLDGFVAGPDGQIDMFNVSDEFFDLTNRLTCQADTALYGRATYQLMNSYWPGAANRPDASKHDKEHSAWYNRVDKIVLSTTLTEVASDKTRLISNNIPDEINKLKREKEKDILIFGSPSVVRSLMHQNLIDEYWLFIAPVILGNGIPFFTGSKSRLNLKLLSNTHFSSGLVALHYQPAV